MRWLLLYLFFLGACRNTDLNRLASASSPYLKQQADNPVDWYEWGEVPLTKAMQENKPLLISIGYASCHWCHVMEEESFMDTAVARIMNEQFICIKVDREERPDIDRIYMNACELISGNAGWPLNAFALPDGSPFYAGTYYEKESWKSLLLQISKTYRQQPGKVKLQAQSLSHGISQLEFSVIDTSVISNSFTSTDYLKIYSAVQHRLDSTFGGLKGAPKFPNAPLLEYQLQHAAITQDTVALQQLRTTLYKMALGGIYDQLEGGFARYTEDSTWATPHFEKMLYDNAQLISIYSQAFKLTRDPLFEKVARQTIDFVFNTLKTEKGAYFSSTNAVSEEGEGHYYTWTYKELETQIPDFVSQFSAYYQVTKSGNWKNGRSVLRAGFTEKQFALLNNLNPETFSAQLAAANQKLLAYRGKRIKPSVDTKIIISWNTLMLMAYTDAYAAFNDITYLNRATQLGELLAAEMNKGIRHIIEAGKEEVFLEDYVLLGKAFLALYQQDFNKDWLFRSATLCEQFIEKFYDKEAGLFYFTSLEKGYPVIRKIGLADTELPAPNASAAILLYQIGCLFDKNEYLQLSAHLFNKIKYELVGDKAPYYGTWAKLAAWYGHGTKEVAIAGSDALLLNKELQQSYLPLAIFLGTEKEEFIPLLKNKVSINKTMIYVCEKGVCKRPVENPQQALKQINQK
ncbi:thioredoxin domain-containing protein [Flavihumibacter cheonanensis]|uniref:thioredoxin domain-containing protein n=1 Tax=Flavihumibacter cheonanensis TaxID=1442385 RepID=UPI001EF7EE2E|nr:thioredoxin domain-containing protein [Flavihumibacter cheonanensis]MCG7754136.1 thioredoxin domain-containing protein [Flavihumibacter cheonanensis]